MNFYSIMLRCLISFNVALLTNGKLHTNFLFSSTCGNNETPEKKRNSNETRN